MCSRSAIAFRRCPRPIYVHTFPWGTHGLEALGRLEAGGVPPGRVVICHADVALDMGYIHRLLARGAWVETLTDQVLRQALRAAKMGVV